MTDTYSELCRTLYKLSHWEQPEGYTPVDTSGDKRWPAYTTDYLLEKLLPFTSVDIFYSWEKFYAVSPTFANDDGTPTGGGDTPREALLELAILLFEDGVLTPEDKA